MIKSLGKNYQAKVFFFIGTVISDHERNFVIKCEGNSLV